MREIKEDLEIAEIMVKALPVPLEGEVLGNITAKNSSWPKNEIPNLQATDKRYILNNKGECPN